MVLKNKMFFFIYFNFLSTICAQVCVQKIYEQIGNMEDTDVNEIPYRTLTGISTSLDCSVACFEDDLCLNLRIHDEVCSLYDSNLQSAGSLPGALYYSKYRDLCPVVDSYILVPSPLMCYKLSTDTKDWSGAEGQCQTDGGQLIVLNKPAKHTFFKQVMSDEGLSYVWVGLKKIGSNFIWVDGTQDTSKWKANGENGDCGEISSEGTLSFGCSATVKYICEILLPP